MPITNRKALAVLGAFAAFGALTASAATLGGLTSTSLGADQSVVASCNTTGIALAYTNVYNAVTNDYQTTAVTISGVNAACSGKAYQLALNSGSTALFNGSGTVTLVTGSQTIAVSPAVVAGQVTKASLVITG